LRVALIKFALFDAIDGVLDPVRIRDGDVIVVFQAPIAPILCQAKRTPRLEHKYFLFL
jgi:hypothetical protein